ncbi:MAG: DUF2169 domain-containing protein [Polyangiaceae bacterium]
MDPRAPRASSDADPSGLEIHAVGACVGATKLWRLQGALNLTVIVKATFTFAPDGAMALTEPAPIGASDLAPSLPRTDVVLTGHAHAPRGNAVQSLNVRLVVFRDAALVDKTIAVRGDVGPNGEIIAFERMPLVHERAYGGPGSEENPRGCGADRARAPNLFDPRHATRPACFAPIPRGFPVRDRLLGALERAGLARPIMEIPLGFDWTYFQSAPEDQRTEPLTGSEWVMLEHLSAEPAMLRSQLPNVAGFARVTGLSSVQEERPQALLADTLQIDADHLRCSVVFRRSFPVRAEELARARLQCALQVGSATVEWPPLKSPLEARKSSLPPPGGERPAFSGTLVIEPAVDARASKVPAVPFHAGAPEALARAGTPPRNLKAAPGFLPKPRTRSEVRVGSGTIDTEPTAQGPRTMPFTKPVGKAPQPSTPPVPVVAPAPAAPGPLEILDETTAGPETADLDPSFDADDAPIARRFTAPSVTPAFAPPHPPMIPPVAPPVAPQAPTPSVVEASPVPATPPGITISPVPGVALEAAPWGVVPARDCFTVIAKVTADIVSKGTAKLRPVPDPLSGERWVETAAGRALAYPTDRALYKVRADVVAIAHAHAPRGPATELDVRFAFGGTDNGFDRELKVFGDRYWVTKGQLGAPSPAQPFLRIPLVWARAFGGPRHEANPVGAGVLDRKRRGPTPLPNVEDPSRRLRTPKQVVPPMCIAPVPLAWRQVNPEDRRGRWPLFADDLDWTRFQCAPHEQQLAFLEGDERFVFHGMHRAHPVLEGALPGVRVRAFATSGDVFEEVPLRLDTVVFTVDELKVDLVFRGALPVPTESAPPSVALRALTEPTASPPMTLDVARVRLRRG